MNRAICYSTGLTACLLLSFSSVAQVLTPPLILLPPQQNPHGIYFASSQPTASEVLAGADVFFRDDHGIHRLTTVANSGDSVDDFAVSDDSALLAYTTGQRPGVSVLHIASGHEDHLPIPSACIYGNCPLARLHFTSDAKHLLFNVTFAPSRHTPPWGWPLYAVRLADGHAEMLAKGELNASGQRVVSDRGKIVFDSADPATTYALPQPPVNVYAIDVDKTGLKQLTDYESTLPKIASAVSIDESGSLISFQVAASYDPQSPSSVYRANSDGTGAESLGASSQSCSSPTLAADGTEIAFVCRGGKLYLAEGRGSPDTQALTAFPYSTIDHLVLDETGSHLQFTAGPTNVYRSGEVGAIFDLDLATRRLSKIQFQPHLSVVNNTYIASFLYPVPGGVITVEGSNLLSNSLIRARGTPLPESLAGATLFVDGEPAPLFSISPWELTAQLPWSTRVGNASFQVRYADGSKTQVLQEPIASNSPWMEGYPSNNSFGCQAAAYHAGTRQLADQAHPARVGERVDLIASGLGPTSPVAADGLPTPSSPAYPISGSLSVYLNSVLSEVKSAALQPGTFGKYRVSVVVPDVRSLTFPEVQISLQMNGSTLVSNSCIFFARTR